MRIQTIAMVAIALLAGTTLASASGKVTKDDAVAMVKKAVALIKAEGAEKAYAEINTPHGKFVNGELYVMVRTWKGKVLAHPVNPKLVGKNLTDQQDVDGKYFSRDLGELGRKNDKGSFWYDFKFVNPVTRKIQVKDMYCESLAPTIVCAGVYRD